MNKFILIQAHAGMSGNFLLRLLSLSNTIVWNDVGFSKDHKIISVDADAQYIKNCSTSSCHMSVLSVVNDDMIAEEYVKTRTEMLKPFLWKVITKNSLCPSIWFFHNVPDKIRKQENNVFIEILPGTDFDIQAMVDRLSFNGKVSYFNDVYKTYDNWVKEIMSSIRYYTDKKITEYTDIIFENKCIFDTQSIITLMKQLEIYHDGIDELIEKHINDYLEANKRPIGLFTSVAPLDYEFKKEVDQIDDPYIRHMLKCINRTDTPTENIIDDPYSYFENFRSDMKNKQKYLDKFEDWKNSLVI